MAPPRAPLRDASNAQRNDKNKENVNPLKRSLFESLKPATPAKKPKLALESPPSPPAPRASTGAYRDHVARGMSMRVLRLPGFRVRPTPPSSLPSLECLVSSITCDSYPSFSPQTRALSLAYSNTAKRGGPPTLAAGTIDGKICIWEARSMRITDGQFPQQRILNVHENYIRDLRWSRDDQLIASASSDHTAKVTSVTTGQCVRTLGQRDADAPVNFVSWDPNNDSLLSTVGRDRQIRIWDLRDNGEAPKLVISPDLPATSSITSSIYLPHEPYSLVTSWNTDGILKKWDFRALSSAKADTSKPVTKPAEESSRDPTRSSSQRARGISSLLYNSRTCSILGLAVNGRIHTYHPFLAAQPDSYTSVSFGYGNAAGARNLFYVRLCESPCGRWVASGSTQGTAHVYDVATQTRASPGGFARGVELRGHTDEVHGIDWATDGLAMASDDSTVSIWRQDIDVAQQCRADPEAQKWNWRWAAREASV